jgi:glycosyltransferase involved in cell wall biosynthesis
MQPLVSILIPAFNAEQWVADAIRSAVRQTWPRKEIIIVDDGSKDQTLWIAQQFASKEVSIVSQPNQGAAAARNKAFSLCRGDHIQWLDADDLLAPDKIERQMRVLESSGSKRTLVSASWGSFMYRPSKARFSPSSLWCDLSPVEWCIRKLNEGTYMQTGTWLVTRELTQAAGPWDTRLLGDDDGEYFCRVILASDAVRFVQDAKVFYRRPGTENLSYIGQSARKMEAHFLSMQLHINHLLSAEDSARVRSAALRYLQWWLVCFYPERPDIINKAVELARALGGRLECPRLPWKYAWIRPIFGWTAAKRTQCYYNHFKSFLARRVDKLLFRLEGCKPLGIGESQGV